MSGSDGYNESLFSTVRLEEIVPANYPLRLIRQWMRYRGLRKNTARLRTLFALAKLRLVRGKLLGTRT